MKRPPSSPVVGCSMTTSPLPEIVPIPYPDDHVDSSHKEIFCSEALDLFDMSETAAYLATLGKYSVVHQIVSSVDSFSSEA